MASIRGLQLQGATVFNTGILTGVAMSLSSVGVHLILESPSNLSLLRQFSTLVQTSRLLFSVAVPVLVGIPYAVLSYASRNSGLKAKLYLFSTALCLAPVPYAVLLMAPTEEKLEEMPKGMVAVTEEDEDEMFLSKREDSARYLVDHWGMLNLGRVTMIAGAGLVGMAASHV